MLCRKHHSLHGALSGLVGQAVPAIPGAEILMITKLWLMTRLKQQRHLSSEHRTETEETCVRFHMTRDCRHTNDKTFRQLF